MKELKNRIRFDRELCPLDWVCQPTVLIFPAMPTIWGAIFAHSDLWWHDVLISCEKSREITDLGGQGVSPEQPQTKNNNNNNPNHISEDHSLDPKDGYLMLQRYLINVLKF